MARPTKEGMDYFPHDTDAANDEKIEALRALYGNDGYAFYFIMLERIYRAKNFELDISDAEIKEETLQILARKVAVSREKFEQILNTAFKWGCFNRDWYEERGVISSEGIKKRAAAVVDKRDKMREKYRKTKEIISDAETTEETEEETPQRKEKKSKVNIYIPVVSYLNEKTGQTYKATTKKTQDLIKARVNEGFDLDDFKKVIDTKTAQWINDDKMSAYLRPETLFSNKFESYLNEIAVTIPDQKPKCHYREL